MRRPTAFLGIVILSLAAVATAQTRRPPARRPAPVPLPPPITVAPEITCPTPLGLGVTTGRSYCDVLSGRDPAGGVLIPLPPHRGTVTLTFDLHNRHTYSEDEMRMKRGYASYTASIGVLTLDNTLITRAVVASEFRKADDLLDRVGGGAGPGGAKAVAPLGSEPISVEIGADLDQLSILGEKLTVVRSDGVPATYSAPGRPIAIISSATIEYTPAPVPAKRKP
jgi:hypothetical protein